SLPPEIFAVPPLSPPFQHKVGGFFRVFSPRPRAAKKIFSAWWFASRRDASSCSNGRAASRETSRGALRTRGVEPRSDRVSQSVVRSVIHSCASGQPPRRYPGEDD